MKKLIFILALAFSGVLSFAQVNGTMWFQNKEQLVQEFNLKYKSDLWGDFEEYYRAETRFGQSVYVSYIFAKPNKYHPEDPSGLISVVFNCISTSSTFDQFITTLKLQDAVFTKDLHLKKGIELLSEDQDLKSDFRDFGGIELLEKSNYSALGFIYTLFTISKDTRFVDFLSKSEKKESKVRYLEASVDNSTFVTCYYDFFEKGNMTVVYTFIPTEEMLK